METLLSYWRDIVGSAEFIVDGAVNYSLMIEYVFVGLLALIVVSNIFKTLRSLFY